MSSLVFLPPMTPASSATPSTSPLGPPPSITRLSVSADIDTVASATARRAVTGLAETSTMRGRPPRTTWVRRRRSERGADDRPALGSITTRGYRPRRLPGSGSGAVEPPQLHVGPGRQAVIGFGDDS